MVDGRTSNSGQMIHFVILSTNSTSQILSVNDSSRWKKSSNRIRNIRVCRNLLPEVQFHALQLKSHEGPTAELIHKTQHFASSHCAITSTSSYNCNYKNIFTVLTLLQGACSLCFFGLFTKVLSGSKQHRISLNFFVLLIGGLSRQGTDS